jgi:hypothetical protein
MEKLFEKASRAAYRFPSVKGELTVEQLWHMPLQSNSKFDLDNVARAVNQELKSVTEDSFVETRSNPRKGSLENKLAIVKYIIQVKIEENKAKREASQRQEEIRKLEDILERKRHQELEGKEASEIEKRLEELRKG